MTIRRGGRVGPKRGGGRKSIGAVIYTRVSTSRHPVSAPDPGTQERLCRQHCARFGLRVIGVRSDAAAGGRDAIERRPGLQRAIADVRMNPGAILVVHSLSRLGRSQRFIWTLLDQDGDYALAVSSATEAFDSSLPLGRAMLGMLAVWAQLEWDLGPPEPALPPPGVSARGLKLGAPTMVESTDKAGARTFDPVKVAIVRRVKDLYASGRYSHRTLAQALNADGVKSVRGARWHPRTVRTAVNTPIPEGETPKGPSTERKGP